MGIKILCIAGPTASGKSDRAITEALTRGRLPAGRQGEIISVDSRQVYRGLDIGTEKIPFEKRRGVPHHLIDVCDPFERYSAGAFGRDAARLIAEITARGALPVLVGGTHFYFDALLRGLPRVAPDRARRDELERLSAEELLRLLEALDPRRAAELDPKNRRRLLRAVEIAQTAGRVPKREEKTDAYEIEWIIIDPPREELRARIDARLSEAFARGLMEEVARVRATVGDERLHEFGLEYRIVGEFLRGERKEAALAGALSAKLWQYARRQKAWLRKLREEDLTAEA